MADMKEGFLCPICMADLGDLIQLQVKWMSTSQHTVKLTIRVKPISTLILWKAAILDSNQILTDDFLCVKSLNRYTVNIRILN